MTEDYLKSALQRVRDAWLEDDEAGWVKSHLFYDDAVAALRTLTEKVADDFFV